MKRLPALPRIAFLACLGLLTVLAAGAADTPDRPLLHPLFTDHAVLQRDRPVPIWGWAQPGARVSVAFAGQNREAVAGPDGRWEVRLRSLRASAEPRTLTVIASDGSPTATVSDLLVGEVWICSGQSNMEWPVSRSNNAEQEIASAAHPTIRLFQVPKRVAYAPETMVKAKWDECSPETVKNFSAVGYFFGRHLNRELGVPVGLIHSSWGGTIAEAWTSAEALAAMPDFSESLSEVANTRAALDRGETNPPLPGNGKANNPNIVTVLYNGMIAPLVPCALRGAIWYQGESNASRGRQYRTLLPILIGDWKHRFEARDLGFHIVSLANFTPVHPVPREAPWAELREAQAMTAQTVPGAGIAMAIDIGEAGDIHPRNKQEVGRRLALSALANTYGRKLTWSGPWYRSMRITDRGIVLKFNHTDGGLVAKDGPLKGFAIAGEDGRFVWADAQIEGKTVRVSSPEVPSPKAVRYAWDANPVANLYNKAGLPAVPFRTDVDAAAPAPSP